MCVGEIQCMDRLAEHGVQVRHDGIIGESLFHRCGGEQGAKFYYISLVCSSVY